MTSESDVRDRAPARIGAVGRADATLRRIFDVVVALAGIVCFLPILIPVVLAIRLDSPGPILYAQNRLGQHGRIFRLYKFRKFHDGATGKAVTVKNDRRMTRVGRFLERTKIDEVPQLWNVLKGEMSVIGPRPETLDFADGFDGVYRGVLDHRPGIFGPNQVYFRNEGALFPENVDPHVFYRAVLFPAKARIDLDYFPRRNLPHDVVWLVRGVFAVFGIGLPSEETLRRFRNLENRAVLPD
ncbi:sugar transferase [Azospirillum sp. TSO22-1]|uniref:sugar transferase n=1 Tax=Azospirillum sp. TSO22-1 TaxID=716789 RepID=UPI000D655438|nr:sugar transferase [Azospirillum sp. TSO22-1]